MLRRRKGGWKLLQYMHAVHKVQENVVATFEITIAARSFKINSSAVRGVKKVGQHRTKV